MIRQLYEEVSFVPRSLNVESPDYPAGRSQLPIHGGEYS